MSKLAKLNYSKSKNYLLSLAAPDLGYCRRQWQPIPVLSPGKSHGRRSLVGCSPWGHWELDMAEQLHFHFSFHALEKKMATHSSVLAWRIPGMGEPRGLPSMGSHRVIHDWSDLAAAAGLGYSTRNTQSLFGELILMHSIAIAKIYLHTDVQREQSVGKECFSGSRESTWRMRNNHPSLKWCLYNIEGRMLEKSFFSTDTRHCWRKTSSKGKIMISGKKIAQKRKTRL